MSLGSLRTREKSPCMSRLKHGTSCCSSPRALLNTVRALSTMRSTRGSLTHHAIRITFVRVRQSAQKQTPSDKLDKHVYNAHHTEASAGESSARDGKARYTSSACQGRPSTCTGTPRSPRRGEHDDAVGERREVGEPTGHDELTRAFALNAQSVAVQFHAADLVPGE
jgi:hypothetical protein